jgi:tyrosyl-tRNA synthetase
VWLDPKRTPVHEFYKFWMNTSDEDAERCVKIFTLKTQGEINALVEEHKKAPHQRSLQRALADDITGRVHPFANALAVGATSHVLFGNKSLEETIRGLEAGDLWASMPHSELAKRTIEGASLVKLMTDLTNFLPSGSEARRALKEGSISINRERVSEDRLIIDADLVNGQFILLQRGKKNYFVVKVV